MSEEIKEEVKEEVKEECGCNCGCESKEEPCCESNCEEEIAKLEKEVQEWKDSYVRKVAEFENAKKRMEREKEEFSKYASEKIITKMIEIIDNMERAIQSASANKDFDNLVKGIEMTLNQAHTVFKSEGVEPLDAKGKEFNPYEHHAMMQEDTEEHPDNTIIEEFQKGYKMKDKVIRPSLVKVARNKKK